MPKSVANQKRRPRRDQPDRVTEAIDVANRKIHHRRSRSLAAKLCWKTSIGRKLNR
ncbi:hypothetical protein SH528x_002885 [Novipirellula sp. SH528]|uniref:hypothetical protein n=1 Tax=Novipirellula sp. SH528 TaxID=3454466 RepID=UPI003FA0B483